MYNSNENSRIAKNTMFLYFRTLATTGVSFYVYSVVLNTLGYEDFGLYSILGSVVISFSFVSSAMASSTQRFLNIAIGQGCQVETNRVFSVSFTIHALYALLIFLASETIGLWFVNNKLLIPDHRVFAANFIFQCSVLSILVTIICLPYYSFLISHERMKIFANMTVLDIFLKLILVYMMKFVVFDKLILYSTLIFFTTVVIQAAYFFYVRWAYDGLKVNLIWNDNLRNDMIRFSGWSFLGASSGVAMNQGIDILLNLYFGPSVNAARAIAFQFQTGVNNFVSGFMVAVSPQIVKAYAVGDNKHMVNLVYSSTKVSFYILHLLTLPLLIYPKFLFTLWLGVVSNETLVYIQLSIIYLMTISLTYAINMASQATGNIRLFQLVESLTLLSCIPLSYIYLENGYSARSTFYVMIVLSSIAFLGRLVALKKIWIFSIKEFLLNVILKCASVYGFSTIITYMCFVNMVNFGDGFKFFTVLLISVLTILVSIWFIGLEKREKEAIKRKFSKIKSY